MDRNGIPSFKYRLDMRKRFPTFGQATLLDIFFNIKRSSIGISKMAMTELKNLSENSIRNLSRNMRLNLEQKKIMLDWKRYQDQL